jgi:hypothetical protein
MDSFDYSNKPWGSTKGGHFLTASVRIRFPKKKISAQWNQSGDSKLLILTTFPDFFRMLSLENAFSGILYSEESRPHGKMKRWLL